ncbi:TIGR02391 family protein [Christensenella intestinihominis]|uniref:TIGR02391 family protein n=1 Tax=Christensenella intestinihominis TaxID=1851429 RepID=UPI00082C5D3A|nr:TIGR02391 family protein [Christensenella intestinihominis]
MDNKILFNKLHILQNQLNCMEGIKKPVEQINIASKTDLYDLVITDHDLRKCTRTLFYNGHHAQAIEEGYKCLNNIVKKKSKLTTEDGNGLMRKALSAKNPILKLNAWESQSEKDEQLGYMDIYAGCMTGIRNPRAHEHEWEDTETRAIQLLTLANHLIEKIKLSKEVPPP